MPLRTPPIFAPQTLLEKLSFRLGIDDNTKKVATFTSLALPELKKFAPDVVVAVNGDNQVKFLKKNLKNTKVVVFGHSGIGYHDQKNLNANPDLFIVLSREAETWATKIASNKTKVIYIPNAVDVQRYSKAKAKKLHLPHPIVMVVGALSSYKNISMVIKGVSLTNASLLIIGDGEEQSKISEELSRLVNDFSWIRHVDPIDLPSYYKASDVFCFVPDPQEAFGLVYIEAMATGLPIVASDDKVRRDIIGKKGIYVDPHEPESISQGLIKAYGLGKVDYASKLENYQIDKVVKKIEKAFYELIK
ncbi:MAG: glycosyltransferase family 4 protein [bacterium]